MCNELRTDFQAYQRQMPGNADHPINKMLRAAFAIREAGNDAGGHNWDVSTAEIVDRVYNANFGNYIAGSTPYQDYRNASDSGRLTAIEWLIKSQCLSWQEFVQTLGNERPARVTASELCKVATDTLAASRLIAEACGKGGDGPISFCSKYGYFLNGITPIINKHANRAVKEIRKINGSWPLRYERFVSEFCEILRYVYPDERRYSSAQIKNLDGYLYERGRGRWSANA